MARIGIRVFDPAVPAGSSFEYGIGARHRVCFGDETTLQTSCSICPAISWSYTLRPFGNSRDALASRRVAGSSDK